jgi:phenylalanyl-tRNA synthetase alpha chain
MATSDLTSQVLGALSESESFLTAVQYPSVPSSVVKSSLDRLASRDMIVYETIDREEAVLTEEGKGIAAEGSHEAKVFEAVRKAVEGLKIADLPVRSTDLSLMLDVC